MANFVLLYHGGAGMPETQEEGAKVVAAWNTWFGEIGDALIDGGNPVSHVKTIHANGSVTDGGTGALTGYSVIKADSLEHAVKLAKGCPVRLGGANVEVAETFNAM